MLLYRGLDEIATLDSSTYHALVGELDVRTRARIGDDHPPLAVDAFQLR